MLQTSKHCICAPNMSLTKATICFENPKNQGFFYLTKLILLENKNTIKTILTDGYTRKSSYQIDVNVKVNKYHQGVQYQTHFKLFLSSAMPTFCSVAFYVYWP